MVFVLHQLLNLKKNTYDKFCQLFHSHYYIITTLLHVTTPLHTCNNPLSDIIIKTTSHIHAVNQIQLLLTSSTTKNTFTILLFTVYSLESKPARQFLEPSVCETLNWKSWRISAQGAICAFFGTPVVITHRG